MPITFSHPVAVLPLIRTRLNFTGLVLGSMAPDFTYFFQGSATGHWGHTLQGLFLFCIPVSLIFYAIFHQVVKESLYQILPLDDQVFIRNTEKPQTFSILFLLILILSIAIGVATHNFWDSFTHSYGYFVQKSDFLQINLFSLLGKKITMYKFLQYSGHLLGIPILGAYYLFAFHEKMNKGFWDREILKQRIFFGIKVSGFGILSLILSGLFVLFTHKNGSFLGSVVVWTMNFGVLGTLIYSISWKIRRATNRVD